MTDIAERGEFPSFMDYLRADTAADADFEIDRRSDLPREIDLAECGVPAGHTIVVSEPPEDCA